MCVGIKKKTLLKITELIKEKFKILKIFFLRITSFQPTETFAYHILSCREFFTFFKGIKAKDGYILTQMTRHSNVQNMADIKSHGIDKEHGRIYWQ